MAVLPSQWRRSGVTLIAVIAALPLSAGAASAVPEAEQIRPAIVDPIQMTPELQRNLQKAVDAWLGKTSASGTSVAVVTPAADGVTAVTTYFSAGSTLHAPTKNFTPEAITPATRFELGSETKVFTADLLAAMLADESVSLTDPVQDYAPSWVNVPVFAGDETDAVPITLGDLATHTAALPDLPSNFDEKCAPNDESCNPRPEYSREMLWQALNDQTLPWEPGTRWHYSNFGFALLGTILADKLHPPVDDAPPAFQEALDSNFLKSLSMNSTFVERGFPGAPFAHPEWPKGGLSWLWDNNNAFVGGGGLLSTAEDMSTWVRAHLGYNEGAVTPGVQAMTNTLDEAVHVQWYCQSYVRSACTKPEGGTRMGLGWELYGPAKWKVGVDFAFKNGGTAGSSSDTALARGKGVGVTAMWNRARGGDGAELAPQLLAMIINPPTPSPTDPATLPGVDPTSTPISSPSPSVTHPTQANASPPSGSVPDQATPSGNADPRLPGRELAETGMDASAAFLAALLATTVAALGVGLLIRHRRQV